jgi:tetratricopeptide (TPR) repeat protein
MDIHAIDAAWDYADPVGSEGRFRALLAAEPDPPTGEPRAEILTQLGRALALQRRFADADAALDDADRLLADRPGRARIRSLLERGRIRRDLSETGEALDLFGRALALADAAGEEFLALDALHMIG